jgi:poly(ADP-ribose) glycohydrolase ARH3
MKRKICYDRNDVSGLLYGTFIGDALGMKFDGCSNESIAPLELDSLLRQISGSYSGDTQMNISVLEEMVENGGVDQVSLGTRILNRYSPWRKYGGGMFIVIERWRDGEAFSGAAECLYNGAGSYGDGAAVRAAPVSCFFKLNDVDYLFEQVRLSSRLTHTNTIGIDGALLQAYAALLALNKVDPLEWTSRMFQLPIDSSFKIKLGQIDYCIRNDVTVKTVIEKIGNGSDALSAVSAAIYSLIRNKNSFVDAVLFAIELGGDTDTIGAMTGALAGAIHGVQSIPQSIKMKLENGIEGISFIDTLIEKAL